MIISINNACSQSAGERSISQLAVARLNFVVHSVVMVVEIFLVCTDVIAPDLITSELSGAFVFVLAESGDVVVHSASDAFGSES